MTFLPDINVLIALIDPAHVGHDAAHAWFGKEGKRSWATCPVTENGLIRIVGHPRYTGGPGSPAEIGAWVKQMTKLPGHVFWPDDISLTGTKHVDIRQIMTSAQITDSYLLALAVAHDGCLATFDRRLSTRAVSGGKAALHLVPN